MNTRINPQPSYIQPRACESLAHPSIDDAPPTTHIVYHRVTETVIAAVYLCSDCAASLAWELGQRERSAA